MVDLSYGLFGALKGGGTAIGDIQMDKRKELANKLRAEAQAELDRARQERGFSHERGMAGEKYARDKELLSERQAGEEALLEKRQAGEGELLGKRQEGQRELMKEEIAAKKDAGLFNERLGPDTLLVSPEGEEVARGIEKPVGGSGSGVANSAKVTAEINDFIQKMQLPKDKGGIGWRPGQRMPKFYLDRINEMRASIGQKPLTEKMIKESTDAIYKPWTWGGGSNEEVGYIPQKENDPWGIR